MKKFFTLLLSAALIVCVFVGCNKPQDEFVAPENYVTIIQVKINPTVNLYLDADEVVLAVEYVNTDAKESYKKIESELVGASLAKSVDLVVKTAVADGYLKENKEVNIEVVDAKNEKKVEVLASAYQAANTVLEEQKIDANIVVKADGNEVAKEELIMPTPNYTAPDPQTPQVTTPEPTSTVRPTEKPAELTLNYTYCIYKFNELGMLERYTIGFKVGDDNVTSYSYSLFLFDLVDYTNGQGVVAEYQGKTYYEAGGRGGAGEFTQRGRTVTLKDDNIILTIVKDGTLKVESVGKNESFLKVGDLLEIPEK